MKLFAADEIRRSRNFAIFVSLQASNIAAAKNRKKNRHDQTMNPEMQSNEKKIFSSSVACNEWSTIILVTF